MFYVYRFINKDNEIIYVGKTNCMESRMYQHRNNKMPFYKEYYKIEYITFEKENEQSFYEILMINKFNPKYNIKDKYNTSFNIEDIKENDWKIYDEIKLYTDEEMSQIYNYYTKMTGRHQGHFKRMMKEKIKYARDDIEKSIRSENYKKFMILCQLQTNQMPKYINDNLSIFESYNNGIGICNENNGSKSIKTLYIRNENNEFQISGCGTVTLTNEQIEAFLKIIIEKYKLSVI